MVQVVAETEPTMTVPTESVPLIAGFVPHEDTEATVPVELICPFEKIWKVVVAEPMLVVEAAIVTVDVPEIVELPSVL